jgi:hypothetical protein
VPYGRGLYICLLSGSNGPNLLDEPSKCFIVYPASLLGSVLGPCKPRAYGLHDSQWKCKTSAECKTIITAVLMVTSGLGLLWNRWSLMIIMFLLFIIPVYLIMWLFGAYAKLCYSIAERWLIKSIVVNLCQTFWALWTPCYICWVRHVLTLAISTTPVRLVINQSVVLVELELPRWRSECFSIVCYLRLYSLY